MEVVVGCGEETEGAFQVEGFTFFSNFDSGNLSHIQLVSQQQDDEDPVPPSSEPSSPQASVSQSRPSTSTAQPRSVGSDSSDYEFELWTRPDCAGTEFENGNRTWFHFGMRGGTPGAVLTFCVKNLNKQAKLFSQGMVPVFMIQGRSCGWERLRDPPTYSTLDNNFMMSFKYRNLDTDWTADSVVFFAFTYPFGYKELQTSLAKLERKYQNGHLDFAALSALPESGLYFHRELVTHTLEERRLDLLTISGLNNMLPEREPVLRGLFPSGTSRPLRFRGKKVVFLSARVHPGETCSSHVINGLIRFLLNEKDARAVALRRKYVFKLVPMLNPDGVFRGHYRTDTRGVNLNRVYSAPSPSLHPTIYATKKLILLAHLGVDVDIEVATPVINKKETVPIVEDDANGKAENLGDILNSVEDHVPNVVPLDTLAPLSEPEWYKPQSFWEAGLGKYSRGRTSASSRVSTSSRSSNMSSSTLSHQFPPFSPVKPAGSTDLALHWYEMTDTSRCSEGDESIADFSVASFGLGPLLGPPGAGRNPLGSDEAAFLPPDTAPPSAYSRTSFSGAFKPKIPITDSPNKVVLNNNEGVEDGPEDRMATDFEEDDIPLYKPGGSGESGLFLYVDIHGHASKRGIFMYGNHFENLETKVSTLLYPKLMAINSANFDFPACNFTQRNMILKDRHTGAGREGSGRVSVYKATGLTYCYTLECNFNTGRHTNAVPMAARDGGRLSPPPSFDLPPKYNPAVYEDCGKYLAVSILDLTEANPWTRLPCSSCKNMKGLRSWIRQYVKNAEAEAAASKAAKSLKSSPMRTRLRSLSAGPKKTPLKARRLQSACLEGSVSISGRHISKVAKKSAPKQASNSVTSPVGKTSRQNSRSKSAKLPDGTKKRSGSAKKIKGQRPSSKTGSKGGSKPGSKPSSRASSPRRSKSDGKSSGKNLLPKKALHKTSWKTTEDLATPADVGRSVKKVKRKKKKLVPPS